MLFSRRPRHAPGRPGLGHRGAPILLVVAVVAALLGSVTPAHAAVGDIGYRGRPFVPSTISPTADRSQSKIWFNDGTWWADFIHTSSKRHQIWRLDRAREAWFTTNTNLDVRTGTSSDILWDGSHLYVASHVKVDNSGLNQIGKPTWLFRYSYDAVNKRYLPDAGFPTKINDVSSEEVVISKDLFGRIWATWTQGRRVMVNHSARGGVSWEVPFVLPVPGALSLTAQDASTVSTYGDVKTGFAWSNQTSATLWFASHDDRQTSRAGWTATAVIQGPKQVDDHVNLRAVDGDRSGRVFLVAKTGLDDVALPAVPDPAAPLIRVWTRDTAGAWTSAVASTVADHHTRPVLSLDNTNKRINVFFTGASTINSQSAEGTIYRKTASMTAPSFVAGLGTPVMRDPSSAHMNDVTATKQTITSAMGLITLASNLATSTYWHCDVPL